MDRILNNAFKQSLVGSYSSGATSIELASISNTPGNADYLPDPADGEYNLIFYNTLYGDPASARNNSSYMIGRVTGIDYGTNTLTITTAQENTSDVAMGSSWAVLYGATANYFSELSLPSVDSISSLIGLDTNFHKKALVSGFYSDTPWGFERKFEWDSSQAKTGHDGWSIINPDHLSTIGSANWYTSDGDNTDDAGNGCWVRKKPLTTVQAVELGAKGDATNDDITAIQAGVTAMASNPLATIEFSEGTYHISTYIELEDHTTLLGNGNVKILATGTDYCVFANYKEHMTLEGIDFEAPNTNIIAYFGVSQNVQISDCGFEHSSQSTDSNASGVRFGVQSGSSRFSEAKNIWIDDCRFKTTGSDILIQPDGTSPDGINNVWVRGNNVDCSLKRTSGLSSAFKFDGNGYPSTEYVVSGNVIDIASQTIDSGILFEEGISGVTAVLNTIKNGNCDSGIRLFHGQKDEPVDEAKLVLNTIKDCGNKANSRAIQVSNISSYDEILISLNTVKDFDGIGLYMWSVTNSSVSGNTFTNITGATGEGKAFYLRDLEDVTFTGNTWKSAVATCEVVDCDNVSFTGNIFREIPKVWFNGGTDIKFSNNNCIETTAVSSTGWIQISSGPINGILISGCTIKTNGDHAIWNGTNSQQNIKIFNNPLLSSASTPIGSNDWAAIEAKNNPDYVSFATGVTSVADGDTINHGVERGSAGGAILTASSAGKTVGVTALSNTQITVSLKNDDGTAVGVAENVYWMVFNDLYNN